MGNQKLRQLRSAIMPRLDPPNPDTYSDRQSEIAAAITSGPRGGLRGPLAMWLHRPELADRAQSFGQYCRYDSSLPPILSELGILVTARCWSAEYEWFAHKRIALEAGLNPEIADAIRLRKRPAFADKSQEIVHDFALALHNDKRVGQDLYDKAVATLGSDAVVDLVAVLGYYSFVSMTLNVFEVLPPADVPREMD
jgi:4-carboxymuconolactone decarboxylase